MNTIPTVGDIVLYNLTDNNRTFIANNSYKPDHAEQLLPVAGIVVNVHQGKDKVEANIKLFPNCEMNREMIVYNSTQGDKPGQWQPKVI